MQRSRSSLQHRIFKKISRLKGVFSLLSKQANRLKLNNWHSPQHLMMKSKSVIQHITRETSPTDGTDVEISQLKC